MKVPTEERYDDILLYLRDNKYPVDASKADKRALRKTAVSFTVVDGILHHKNGDLVTRVVTNNEEKMRIIQGMHDDSVGGGHFGFHSTFDKIRKRFWWKGYSGDIKDYVQACDQCQKANPSTKAPVATLHPVKVKHIFHRWGIDLVGPLKETKFGNKYIAVATEYLTKWPEVKALPDKSAKSVHSFLMDLVYRFGACNVLIHDQGKEFNNALVGSLMNEMGISRAMTSAYHPQSNGLAIYLSINMRYLYLFFVC